VQGKKSVGDPIAFTIYRNRQILNLRTISKLFLSIILFASRIVLLFRTAISNRSHIRYVWDRWINYLSYCRMQFEYLSDQWPNGRIVLWVFQTSRLM